MKLKETAFSGTEMTHKVLLASLISESEVEASVFKYVHFRSCLVFSSSIEYVKLFLYLGTAW